MWVALTSVVLAFLGAVATGIAADRLAAREPGRDAHVYWALGLAALLPAWLIVFVTLLPDVPGTRQHLAAAAAWILSAAAGLLGAIATEGRLRRFDESGQHPSPRRLWRLGVVALAPSWAIALISHVLR